MEGGARISDKEFIVLPELLMRQLLKLDSIEAEGETRVQRRSEVNIWMIVLIFFLRCVFIADVFAGAAGAEISGDTGCFEGEER